VARVRGTQQPPSSTPTPKPAAAPTPAAPTTYTTPNGPRTLTQIRDELRQAGWGGGSDEDALATYRHVASGGQ
jgi:hypothetical protein